MMVVPEETAPLTEEMDFGEDVYFMSHTVEQEQDFFAKQLILNHRFEKCGASEFYRFIFPEGTFERDGHQEDGKPNGMAIRSWRDSNGKKYGKKTIITDEHYQITTLIKDMHPNKGSEDTRIYDPAFLISPVSYVGRTPTAENARWLHALTIDLDYNGEEELLLLLEAAGGMFVPQPTFIVNSGNGVHLYYVLDKPVAMYPAAQKELKRLKDGIVRRVWTKKYSKRPKERQFGSIVQSFRMPDSPTKFGYPYMVTAYKTGGRVSLEVLMKYWLAAAVNDKEISTENFHYKNKYTLEEAKEKFPDWYQKRIVNKEPANRWTNKRALYDWYIRYMTTKVVEGHRYFSIIALIAYGQKCGISYKEIEADAFRVQKYYQDNLRAGDALFTLEDTKDALLAYSNDWSRLPITKVEEFTGVPIPNRNKRNFRKQAQHLRIARMTRDILQEENNTNWWDNAGAPSKEKMIKEFAAENPNLSNRKIAAALGISRNTVNKWLKKEGSNA